MNKDIFYIAGSEVLQCLRDLYKKASVRRVVIRSGRRVILDIPVAATGLALVLAPLLSGLSLVLALVSHCTIEVYEVDENGL